jgi:CMP-N,N'-diacetyllegionaminic acid synthase
VIALIGARGGSKGIPGKNIKDLAGKPLIAHAIDAAKAVKDLKRIVVSTDSEEIAAVARKFGAEVPFMRPPALAQDNSNAIDAYLDAVFRLRSAGDPVNEICVLQPTSPLRTPEDIRAALEIFRVRKADCVVSVCEAPHPVSWYRRIDPAGVLRPVFEATGRNRQEEETLFIPNGAVYVFRADFLAQRQGYYSDSCFPYVMPRERSIDLDTPFDWKMAEMFLSGGRG